MQKDASKEVLEIIDNWGRKGFDGDVEAMIASRCDQSSQKVAT